MAFTYTYPPPCKTFGCVCVVETIKYMKKIQTFPRVHCVPSPLSCFEFSSFIFILVILLFFRQLTNFYKCKHKGGFIPPPFTSCKWALIPFIKMFFVHSCVCVCVFSWFWVCLELHILSLSSMYMSKRELELDNPPPKSRLNYHMK